MSEPIRMRRAQAEDVAEIVEMLADDMIGRGRETAEDLTPYLKAFQEIDADPRQLLAVAEADGRIVGTLQITFIPYLSRRGATRALVEAVRVRTDERGKGIGARMMEWAESQARERGCPLVQLTSARTREDAHRFYERLGYEPTHVGFKKPLPPSAD
ncbi:GNAT family N-acetyltransferase [Nocardiopsis chromatogenes]|uniref:GNAT family N-acetyltransferase n=1 Tax=Nocardiopsis chromatogenes TaxID=280239 RepID=UPI0003477FD4|nr:GNAT family N-acetyltransferase [Nocardiopsis chromatogenes]